MLNLQRKKRAKKILYSKVTIVGASIIVFILLNATWNAYQNTRFTKDNLERSERELAELQERAEFLRGKTKTLSTPEGIEREIRENLPVAKEGERVIILVEDEEADEAEEESAEENDAGWRRFFHGFRW